MISRLRHSLLIVAGILSLALGVIGIFLPLLPTVPLVLLSGFCFARSSERLHSWLISHPHFGSILRNFEAGKGIPRRIKVKAIITIWIVMLAVIGLVVSFYLWSQPEPLLETQMLE